MSCYFTKFLRAFAPHNIPLNCSYALCVVLQVMYLLYNPALAVYIKLACKFGASYHLFHMIGPLIISFVDKGIYTVVPMYM